MGIPTIHAKILFYSTKLGVRYDRTATLGRQNLYTSIADIETYAHEYLNRSLEIDGDSKSSEYSEPLFKALGATLVDSIDYSDYEGATLIHDLNDPIGEELKNRYSAIVDGGTLEHIFNIPVALRNCMQMLRIGGHFVAFTTANNYCGHGFYQFSPELFFRVFSKNNGFNVKLMAMHSEGSSKIFRVKDPMQVKSRIEFISKSIDPLCLIVIAEKIHDVDLFKLNPQQTDYDALWASRSENTEANEKTHQISLVRRVYRQIPIPMKIKNVIYHVYYKIRFRKSRIPDFARVHANFVERIDI